MGEYHRTSINRGVMVERYDSLVRDNEVIAAQARWLGQFDRDEDRRNYLRLSCASG
jgi:hypothetical protein